MKLFLSLMYAFLGIGNMYLGKKDDSNIALFCSLLWMFSSGAMFCKWLIDLCVK